ncbi:MAG TPA: TolC family protein [candidate division Zixibacteria bacterium]|nr:TolC family protein [candidate division Zixibacteria bacterium]
MKRKIKTGLFLSLFIALPLTRTARAAPELLETNPDSALALTLAQFEGSYLSLEEAKSEAMKHATSVQEAKAALKVAGGTHRREKGAFDPELFAEGEKSRFRQPVAFAVPQVGSFSFVQEDERLSGSAGLRLKFPLGTQVEASLNTIRLESNSPNLLLKPQYTNFGKLEITQPILSGFGPGAASNLSSARRGLEAARARYADAVLSLTARVEQTYWDLYAAERDLAVQILIRDRAAAFLKETELKAAVGRVGPNQVANAKVFLAEQEQAVLDREENLDKISDQLATLLGQRSASIRYRPSDQPPGDFPVEDPDSLVTRALASNRNLKVAEKNWAAARSLAKGAGWNALPKLDLYGTLGANGLSGTDTLGGPFDGNADKAWTQVFQRDYPTWNVGFRFSLPIGLRSGLGERQRLNGEAERAYQQYVAARRGLEEDVRAGYRELLHAQKRLEAARTGVEASAEQVRIGMLEYQVGRTTAFELVRLSADLATAQQRYSQALVRAAKAASELKKLTSSAIETQNKN